jgi:hypothetical protein
MYKLTVYVACVYWRKAGKVARTEDRSFDLEHIWQKADALPAELRPVGLAAGPPQKRPPLYSDALFKAWTLVESTDFEGSYTLQSFKFDKANSDNLLFRETRLILILPGNCFGTRLRGSLAAGCSKEILRCTFDKAAASVCGSL